MGFVALLKSRSVHWAWLLVVQLCTACELGANVQGLAEELGNPELTNVESPGHLIASGKFESFSFDGNDADGAVVVSIQDGSTLSIVRFPEGEGCNAGPASDYGVSVAARSEALNARIPILVPGAEEDEPATLRFVNFECEVDDLELKGASLPLGQFGDAPGFIVESSGKQLLHVNPWSGKTRLIAKDVTPILRSLRFRLAPGKGGDKWMWTLEGGQLVGRDNKFREVFRAGSAIEQVIHQATKGGPIMLLSTAGGDLLTARPDDSASLRVIARDACGPYVHEGAAGTQLLFYSPCDARTLRVTALDSPAPREIGSNVVDYKLIGDSETGPALMYVVEKADDSTLWARWGQNDPIRLGKDGNLKLSRVTSKREARVVVDWDGQGGTLLVGPLGEALTPRANAVAYHSSAGIISNFDGENGTLRRFVDAESLEVIAKDLAAVGVRNDGRRDRALFLKDFDGTTGHLVLLDGDLQRPLTQNVRPDRYRFSELQQRVFVQSDFDTETKTFTLSMPSMEFDDAGLINRGVDDYVEVDWPRQGVLYSLPGGKAPGIYFAKYY